MSIHVPHTTFGLPFELHSAALCDALQTNEHLEEKLRQRSMFIDELVEQLELMKVGLQIKKK